MELRKISPLTELNRDKPWTRWEKWGKASITLPKSFNHPKIGNSVMLNPAIRIRSDGIVHNSETDEYFQADKQMLDFLSMFHSPSKNFPEGESATTEALTHGILIATE